MFRATSASLLRHTSTLAFQRPICGRYGLSKYLGQPLHRPSRTFTSSQPAQARIQYIRFDGPRGKGPQRDTTVKIAAGVGILAAVYYVSHLEQVPETGRWRFMNTSPQFEEKFGRMAREETLQEYEHNTLPANHPLSRHVRRVVARILAASNLGHIRGESTTLSEIPPMPYHGESGGEIPWDPDARIGAGASQHGPEREWDVIVVNDPKMINAQAVPGLIVVYTGILPVCKDEQGLSAVLSHEIGHVVARHSAERISSQTITLSLIFVLQLLGLDFGFSNLVQNLIFQLPNSRTQELEADKIGMTLMSRACFDPRGAVEMFERLGQVEAKMSRVNLDFLQTHPSSKTRVEKLEKLLPDAYAVLAASPECAAMQERLQGFRAAALAPQRDAEFWT